MLKSLSINILGILIITCLTTGCSGSQSENKSVKLSDEEIENIVRLSYPYVAMYNVNNKFADKQGGWNTVDADTTLKDHTMQDIARPNNDTLYISSLLDLRKDAMIIEIPAFDSDYVSLMITGYDHFVNVPLSTRLGDFQKPERILLYSERTEGYDGESIEGIDHIFETTGDFISAVFRIMPHSNEASRFKRIVDQMEAVEIIPLSEYLGKEGKPADTINFPEVGEREADVFENNLLEVMQFVFNHTTFDQKNELDRQVLAVYEPLGVAPGRVFDPDGVVKVDGNRFRKIAERVWTEEMKKTNDPEFKKKSILNLFQPKGKISSELLVFQSVLGPIGQPAVEAVYPPIATKDGKPMNAKNDYVIRMAKEEMPPAEAFWSLTLYDTKNGFFIPNDRKKYSVGENGGMKLNDEGGIEVYISAEKPEGVPEENWLPIIRKDEEIDIVMRIYVPDLEKFKTWTPPLAEKVGEAETKKKQVSEEKELGSSETNPYMGAAPTLVKAPNGAITNKKLLDRIGDFSWLEPTIENPAKGIWVFGGYGLAPMSIIETEEGLIAFDTGDTKHDGELMLEAIRTITDKPIKVIIYGHSHTVAGAGVLAEGNEEIMVIGHPNLNKVVEENIGGGGAPSFYPEVSPYLSARALTQFNTYMPKEGPDAFVVPTNLTNTETAFLPVNTPVEDGQEMTIMGIKFQFFTKYGSDDKVHTTVWLPERKIVFTTLLWSAPPQLYSLRGDVFRDPRVWIEGLKFTRDLNAEVLVSAGSRPVVGKEKVRNTLEQYLDGASFVLDQTLRGILGGLGPDDLRHFVKFPKYLDDAPINLQSYGEISTYPPAIYYQTVGWYDNDAANLKPLAPADEARRLVNLIGGRKKVLEAAKEALDKKEYSWAAKLANQVYLINNQDPEARKIKAESLRQMAYVSTGANDRAHLMSQALALEGKTTIARLIPPPAEAIAHNPSKYVDYFRVRIDPLKSNDTNKFILFRFSDGKEAGLHIRRAVAEFVADPDGHHKKPDIILEMSGLTWAKVYLSQAALDELIANGEIEIEGDRGEAVSLINLFDRYLPEKAVVIPPAFLDHAY